MGLNYGEKKKIVKDNENRFFQFYISNFFNVTTITGRMIRAS